MSDGWAAYANIDACYLHSLIVHQQNFVDPNDPRVHTEYVENVDAS